MSARLRHSPLLRTDRSTGYAWLLIEAPEGRVSVLKKGGSLARRYLAR